MRPQYFHADEHEIDPQQIDADALEVVRKLTEAGYLAYLVGGSVRDLLTKKCPKDFDVSTSATPEQVKKVFGRQCILIGRRFRLAHVRFGRKIIEVATFRRGEATDELIVRDNVWGSPEEDVLRRDFTINGLFLDPDKHRVIDYVGGWKDIHKGLLRTIGDPNARFRQDPVRMLRLIKFQARFGFSIDPLTAKALQSCRDEIVKSAPARVLEEFLRMMESGAAKPFFSLLKEYEMLEVIFPWLSNFIDRNSGSDLYSYLEAVDELHRTRPHRLLKRSVLAAVLLFPILRSEIKSQLIDRKRSPTMGRVQELIHHLIDAVTHTVFSHFPRKMCVEIESILTQQFRFTPLISRHTSKKVQANEEFSMALSLLKVRSLVNTNLASVYESWKELYLQERERQGKPTNRQRGKENPVAKEG